MEEIMTQDHNVITYTDYATYKHDLDTELQGAVEKFVRIGYLLKVAQDTGILAGSGYSNVNEFAMKEYGLDKTQVSRFIRINDRFSKRWLFHGTERGISEIRLCEIITYADTAG